ncbi:MAG: amino acid ABC transporter permease [Deltaproteobacteria bacterium]|nr:amino acid ABC transporter permease [Deltaproteobacteria bacterium]
MSYQFDWSVLWTGPASVWLLQGILTTIEISFLAWLLAVMLGISSGALRTLSHPALRMPAGLYVEFFRNVPLLVWMFFWYFAIPPLLHASFRDWLFNHGAEFWAGMLALGVYHGARFSEVIRSGIQSVPKSLFEAALSTGLTVTQSYRLVIIPIALRLIIPPMTNESLNLLKNSSIALTISVAEVTFQTRQIETYTGRAFEALAAGTVIYLILCLGISRLASRIERRSAIPGMIVRVGSAGL